MWMNETLASGMVPYYHLIGAENGMGEDRRWLEPARQYFQWTARHDPHFINKRSIANLGVVMGQRTHLFYTPPRGAPMPQYMDGMYYALLEGRFLFDFVHEDNLAPEDLKKYSALLLPNTALLSDQQCRQLRAYVEPAARCWRRSKPACTTSATSAAPISAWPMFSASARRATSIGTTGNAFYGAHREAACHPRGFADTNWLPGAENRVPVAPVEGPVLTVVPGFVAYPPELSYPPQPRTDEPAVVVREKGKSRWSISPATSSAPCGVPAIPIWPAAAKLHPLGRGRESAGDHRGRWRHRDVRLGNRSRLRRPHPQLHQSHHASGLDPRTSIPSARKKYDEAAGRAPRDPRGTTAGRNQRALPRSRRRHRVHRSQSAGLRSGGSRDRRRRLPSLPSG